MKQTTKTMLSIIAVAAMLLVFTSMGVPAEKGETIKKRPALELRYIANEGVMLSSTKGKVLIDALFNNPHPNYNAPPEETMKMILNGRPPFDNINLALVTHNHRDHFEASVAATFLENHPGAFLAAPADAVKTLKETCKNWEKIRARVVTFDLKIGETSAREINGISVQAFRTLHSGDRKEPENLVYLVNLEGWSIFHEGDSNGYTETFKSFKLEEKTIDLALVHFWFPLDQGGAKILQEILRPGHIGLIHLPKHLESDAPGQINLVRKHYKDIFLLLPGTAPKTFH
ncbi:MAG: MBL fold metallo-hydrolase [bacterium]|nr:MBL fold metallo-hydrolase [bacterium]